jgi:hypothetical protein
LAREAVSNARIAVVEGDGLTASFSSEEWLRARTAMCLQLFLSAANVYLGASPIADAGWRCRRGGDWPGGRSFSGTGPLMHAHGWDWSDWGRGAVGTLAGHLLECGAQVTGGYFADPGLKDVPELASVGYPIAEVGAAGILVVTKPAGSGGIVNARTVSEQILYEVHDPSAYLTPDVVLDITDVELSPDGPHRIRVSGARGKPRPDTLKATVFVESGVLGEAEISYAGPNALARARLAADIVKERLSLRAEARRQVDASGVRAYSAIATRMGWDRYRPEVRLRFAAQHARRELVELLLDEVEALCARARRRGGSTSAPRPASCERIVPDRARKGHAGGELRGNVGMSPRVSTAP